MLRPERITFLPNMTATSMTCWIRWILEAKVAMMILPRASEKMSSNALRTSFSEKVKPPPLCIGAVGKKQQRSLLAVFGKLVKVHELAIDRRRVELEVTRMDDQSDRCLYAVRHAVDNAMGHADRFKREGAFADDVTAA